MDTHTQDAGDMEPKPPAQVFARCNFCNQPLALPMIHPSKMTAQLATKSRAAKGKCVLLCYYICACVGDGIEVTFATKPLALPIE